MKTWRIRKTNEALALKLSETLHLPLPLMKIMVQRGFDNPEDIRHFLFADLTQLSRPFQLPNIGVAVEAIDNAMKQKEKIVIYGDYDVDGICAATLMKQVFSWMGYAVDIYIPSRFKEGYGMNAQALEHLYKKGARFIITVDNGVASAELIETFQNKGMTFVVTDHHQLPERLPDCVMVNPLIEPDKKAAYRTLCGCGTAYFLAMGMLIRLAPDLYDVAHQRALLDLVAVATVADMMPLHADNRILVREGLKVLNEGGRPGLHALCEAVGLQQTVKAVDIGFRIAPCINACGRLDETETALALLADDGSHAIELAKQVFEANESRKEIERSMVESAVKQFDDHAGRVNCAIAYGENWHKGVLGLAASRLVERFRCPAIVLTNSAEQPELYSGSARSVEGFHLFEALQKASPYLEQFGGHAMAAGLSIRKENLAAFTDAIEQEVAQHIASGDIVDELWIDDVLKVSDIDDVLYENLELLEPCGQSNPAPLFALVHQLQFHQRIIGKQQNHLRIEFPTPDGEVLPAVAFFKADFPFKEGCRYDFAFRLSENCFRDECRLQLQITQIQPAYRATENLMQSVFIESGENYLDSSRTGLTAKRTFHTKLRGVTYENRQDVIAKMAVGESLDFMREYQNSADKNAIACFRKNGEKCGYLSRRIAAQFAPVMDIGGHITGIVEEITGDGEQARGVNIKVCNQFAAELAETQKAERQQFQQYPRQEILGMLTEIFLGDMGQLLPIQARAIWSITEAKRDTTILMPTGRGKSLIYQLSAALLAFESSKMTIVISPLKALIRDQYTSLMNTLAAVGLSIALGNGDLSQEERTILLTDISEAKVDILLVTPEFFVRHQQLFFEQQAHIAQIVIDEAHYLLSKRLAYKQVLALKPKFSTSVWTYLTATVPVSDAEAFRKIISSTALYIDDHIRYNLHIIDARHTDNKLLYVYRLLMRDDKTICYVNSRKKAFELSQRLREVLPYQLRHKVFYYHGGLPQTVRRDVEMAFKEGEIQILFATTAFGEGIHIPDIRNVVLYHPCFSVEAFIQLSGRCARDGEEGYIHLIYGEKDLGLNEKIISQRAPSRRQLGNMYVSLKKYAQNQQYIIEGKTNDIYERLLDLNEDTSKRLWHLALRIFNELDFLKMSEADEQLHIEMIENPAFRQLDDASAFVEGMGEVRALETYKKIAFSKDKKMLENMIQTILRPDTWVGEEV